MNKWQALVAIVIIIGFFAVLIVAILAESRGV